MGVLVHINDMQSKLDALKVTRRRPPPRRGCRRLCRIRAFRGEL